MRLVKAMALGALAFGAMLGMGSAERRQIGVSIAEAADGCGVGFHRGRYGACRRNYYRGGVYYGGVYGYRGGAVYYGRRYYGGRGVYRRGAYYAGRGVYRRGGYYRGRGVGGRIRR